PQTYLFGPFLVDTGEGLLLRDGLPLPLTPKAFETLVALVRRSGHVVSKDELMREVWPDSFVEENNLSQNISQLRRILESAGGEGVVRYIETVPRRGYRFNAPVTAHEGGYDTLLVREVTRTRVVIEEEEDDTEAPRLRPHAPAGVRDQLTGAAGEPGALQLVPYGFPPPVGGRLAPAGRAGEFPPELQRIPETHYARSGDVNIAYQVLGDAPLDLVFVMGWVSHIEYFWAEPTFARFLRRLATFSRLILFDKRGTGLSDRVPLNELPTLEQRMDDVRAVLDAVGSDRAALCGVSEGGPMSALFAATYPEKTSALVMIGTYAKRIWSPDYPWAPAADRRQQFFEEMREQWGGPVGIEERAPSLAGDPHFREWWATYLRMGASPGAAVALTKMNAEIDVRPVLPTVRVPTLVIHRTNDLCLKVEEGRYVAAQIPGAKFVELPGRDHLPFVGDQDAILDEVEEFVTGVRHTHEPDRVLATVLFARIVDPPARRAALGEARWAELINRLQSHVRKEIDWSRGRESDMAGEGPLATFDGPARGIRAACAVSEYAARLGVEVHAGLHTGECDMLEGGHVGGLAVRIGAAVRDRAGAGEVWVSSTVKDLVAGSGIEFEDCGAHLLEGVPGEWRLFKVDHGCR
ncbi:MAG: alpha/beta fold hydrolase, partial [Pyrinomonadaceae bacterium]